MRMCDKCNKELIPNNVGTTSYYLHKDSKKFECGDNFYDFMKEVLEEYLCVKCGKKMRVNVPRLGEKSGFVHDETSKFECEGSVMKEISECGENRVIINAMESLCGETEESIEKVIKLIDLTHGQGRINFEKMELLEERMQLISEKIDYLIAEFEEK